MVAIASWLIPTAWRFIATLLDSDGDPLIPYRVTENVRIIVGVLA